MTDVIIDELLAAADGAWPVMTHAGEVLRALGKPELAKLLRDASVALARAIDEAKGEAQ